MSDFRMSLIAERLRAVVDFDGATGVFVWRARSREEFASARAHAAYNSKYAGRVAGSGDGSGYQQLRVDGAKYRAHRLAWLYAHGTWPNGHIDHINGDRSDNRISNLREADDAVNNQNLRRAKRTNRSGFLGVSTKGPRFEASIYVAGTIHRLGRFDSAADAHAVYLEAKRRLHAGGAL